MEGHGGLYSATKPRQIGATRGYSRWLHLLQMALAFTGGRGRAARAQGRGTITGPWHTANPPL